MGSIVGGIGSYLGAKEQASAMDKASKRQIDALKEAAKKLEADYEEALSGAGGNVFGKVPAAALFQPISLAGGQLDALQANKGALGLVEQLTGQVNDQALNEDLQRAKTLVPGYEQTTGNLGRAAQSLSAGQLPFDDLQDIVSNRSSSSGALNVPGGSGPATLRDLGLSRLSAINQGNSLFQSMLNGAESVNPVGSQMKAQDFLVGPQQALGLNLTQAQLSQNSAQNANDLAAAADPTAQGKLQLQLQGANNAASTRAQIGGLQSPVFPNNAQAFGQIGQGVGDFLGNLFNIPGFTTK